MRRLNPTALFLCILSLTLLASANAWASEAVKQGSEIEISAPRVHLGKKPSQKINLTGNENQLVRPSLDSALEREGNIQVVPTPLKNSTVSLNGLSGEHVAIAIDGDPIAGRIEGAFDTRNLILGSSERIGIYQGFDSLPYGSQNIAGVINLESPWSVSKKNEFQAATGSLGRTLLKVTSKQNFNGSQNHFWGSASNWRSKAYSHPDRPKDTISNAVARTGVDFGASRFNVFSAFGRDFDVRATGLFNTQNSKGLLSGEQTVQDQNRYAAALDLRSERSFFRFGWNRYENDFKGLATDNTPNREDRDAEEVFRFGPHIEETINATTYLFGAQGEVHEVASTRMPGNFDSKTTVGTYAGVREVLSSSVTIGGGARYDSGPGLVSPRAEISHVIDSSLGEHTTQLRTGLGFRDVTAKERYLSFENSAVGYRVVGNPNLLVERAWISDLKHALAWHDGDVEAGVSFVRVRDSIGYVPQLSATGVWTYANVGTTQTISARTQWTQHLFENVSSKVQLQFLDGKNISTGGDLFLQPTERVSAQLGRNVRKGFSLFGNGVWTGRQAFVDSNHNGITDDEWIASYWMLGAEAAYGFGANSLTDCLRVYVRVDNAFDVVRPRTFPVEPRTFIAGVTAEL